MAQKKDEAAQVEQVINTLTQSGVIDPNARISDMMRATQELKDITVQYTVVYDSDKWALVVK